MGEDWDGGVGCHQAIAAGGSRVHEYLEIVSNWFWLNERQGRRIPFGKPLPQWEENHD
jgi:hypothetical protein